MNKIINKVRFNIKNAYEKEYIKLFFTFVFIFVCFSIVYFFTNKLVSLDDPLFHIRFAEIIREKGLGAFKDFHWIYFSKISQDQTYFIYYNFLFYLAIIPFTFIKPLFLGIKLYGIVFLSFSFTALYYFLLKVNIKKPFFWVVIFLALITYTSVGRFLSARPFAFAPALLILELYFLYRKKYLSVFLLSFLYVYWHTATFFFPPMIAIFFYVFEKFYGKKTELRSICASLTGTAIAIGGIFIFTPGFLNYMKEIVFENVYNTAISNEISIREGSELYAINFFDYIRLSVPMMILFVTAVVFEICQYVQARKKNICFSLSTFDDRQPLKGALFFLSLLFFLGIFFSMRNADFYIFFSIAYIAISFDHILNYIDFKDKGVKASFLAAFLIVFSYLFVGNMLFITNHIAQTQSVETFKEASVWLKNNTDKKEIIFNPTWNWFPQLFYYNSDNYYVTGIEPRFFYDYNPELYWAWQNISDYGYLCFKEKCDEINKKYYSLDDEEKKKWQQEEGDKVAGYIKNTFHSRFIITSGDFVNLNLILGGSSYFEKVFTDKTYGVYVYKIK